MHKQWYVRVLYSCYKLTVMVCADMSECMQFNCVVNLSLALRTDFPRKQVLTRTKII